MKKIYGVTQSFMLMKAMNTDEDASDKTCPLTGEKPKGVYYTPRVYYFVEVISYLRAGFA